MISLPSGLILEPHLASAGCSSVETSGVAPVYVASEAIGTNAAVDDGTESPRAVIVSLAETKYPVDLILWLFKSENSK